MNKLLVPQFSQLLTGIKAQNILDEFRYLKNGVKTFQMNDGLRIKTDIDDKVFTYKGKSKIVTQVTPNGNGLAVQLIDVNKYPIMVKKELEYQAQELLDRMLVNNNILTPLKYAFWQYVFRSNIMKAISSINFPETEGKFNNVINGEKYMITGESFVTDLPIMAIYLKKEK